MKTYEEAVAYAKRHGEPGLIMRCPETGTYHYIVGLFDHWKKMYEVIAEVQVVVTIDRIKD